MVYEKIVIHPFNVEKTTDNLKRLVNDTEFKLIKEFLDALQRGEVTGKAISDKRRIKLMDMLVIFYKQGYKTVKTLTIDDMRKFKDNLQNDVIRKVNGSAYSIDTKNDITNTLLRFLEFYSPKKVNSFASKHLSFRKWFQIKKIRKTPEILTEAEVKKLIDATKTIEGKFLVCVLFDSGSRIEEFLNIRFEDIEEPTTNHPYYRIDFKEEYSKTNGRKISMFWEYSTEIISKFLACCENKEPKKVIYPKDYDAVRMFLSRLGKKVLSKRIHPHMFRKSSATYYADKLNRQQLAKRYGWIFSSNMLDIYISRSGFDEEKIKETILNDDLSKLRKDINEKETRIKLLENNKSATDNKVKSLEMNILKLLNAIEDNQTKKVKDLLIH